MSFDLTCKVKEVSPLGNYQKVVNGNVNVFSYKEVLVEEANATYPTTAKVTLRGEKAVNFNYQPGTKVKLYFNLNTYTTQNGHVLNCVNVWKYELITNAD